MTFVIADDSPIYRGKIKQFLEAGGHRVVAQASDGKKALELCRKYRPDAVALDISMPFLSGDQAAKRVAEERLVRYIFMLTSFQQEAGLASLRDLGVVIINKPFHREKLLQTIDRATGV